MAEKQIRQTSFRLDENEHQALKFLAVKEKKTLQELLVAALDKAYPGWRELNK